MLSKLDKSNNGYTKFETRNVYVLYYGGLTGKMQCY